jgi:hypothetical protein
VNIEFFNSHYWKRAVRRYAGELVRGKSVADGDDLSEYRELPDDESGVCVGEMDFDAAQ